MCRLLGLRLESYTLLHMPFKSGSRYSSISVCVVNDTHLPGTYRMELNLKKGRVEAFISLEAGFCTDPAMHRNNMN